MALLPQTVFIRMGRYRNAVGQFLSQARHENNELRHNMANGK